MATAAQRQAKLEEVVSSSGLLPESVTRSAGPGRPDQTKLIWHLASEEPPKTVCGKDYMSTDWVDPKRMPKKVGTVCIDCKRAHAWELQEIGAAVRAANAELTA